jgi:hypothetical protein
MKFEEILWDFRNRLYAEYGKEPQFKIVFEPELFDHIAMELFRKHENFSVVRPSGLNDLRVCGIKIDARSKEEL